MKSNLKAEWVERIFMVLHGRFGNTFFNKYKVGKLNTNGEDAGLVNARSVWSSELAGMSAERIKNALEASYDHAPSCDEFKYNCKTKATIEDFKAITSKTDYETNKQYSANIVEFVAKNYVPKTDYHAWAKRMVENPKKFNAEHVASAKKVLGIA